MSYIDSPKKIESGCIRYGIRVDTFNAKKNIIKHTN